jgi:hypothetical protein
MSEPTLVLRSTLTCPHCGGATEELMKTDACQFFYDCKACGAVLRPKAGDCCVFCSYGSVPCPPKQQDAKGAPKCCS